MDSSKFRKIAITGYILLSIVEVAIYVYMPDPGDNESIKEVINQFANFNLYRNRTLSDTLMLSGGVLLLSFLITAWKNLRISLYLYLILTITFFVSDYVSGGSIISVNYVFANEIIALGHVLEGFIFCCVLLDNFKNE